jgi:hypothetical protein
MKHLRKRLVRAAAAVGLAFGAPTGASAATAIFAGGLLTGAQNVNVSGTLYDVDFFDGVCAGLIGGCDEVSDFVFQSFDAAEAASQALRDQVLIGSTLGSFILEPENISGCTSMSQCLIMTPHDLVDLNEDGLYNQVRFVAAYIGDGGTTSTTSGGRNIGIDMSFASNRVWADWQAVAVPLPAAFPLLGTGLALLGFLGWRRRRKMAQAV